MSADAARPILRELGVDEARIVQDADRIEALGAISIARAFYIAGMLGGGAAKVSIQEDD